MTIDSVDSKAIRLLQQTGRMSWAELGEHLGLSAPAAAERIRKLEERGIIRGYAALCDAESLGYPLMAFIWVTLQDQKRRSVFLKGVARLGEVSECHHIAGEDDYLVKVRCRGTRDLDRLLVEEFKTKLGVARTRTTIVLATAKETTFLPVATNHT